MSTLSKIVSPGLRLGWVRAPRALLGQLTIAKQAADLHSSTIDQAAAARWLTTTDLDAHITRLRSAYAARRDALLEGLMDALPPGSTHNHPDGGMFVWARLPDGWDAATLLPKPSSTTSPTSPEQRSSPESLTARPFASPLPPTDQKRSATA